MERDASTTQSSLRVSSVQRAIEERIANPLFRSALRSRFHWIVCKWLMLVSYVGRRSGRAYTFSVAYHQLNGTVVTVTPKEESNWWRNFHDARECHVWLRGTEYTTSGELVTGHERGLASSDQLVEANRDLAVVRSTLDDI